ncbi:hypothetical protein [Chondromyces apiculatus]|uniref:Vcbs protein n=1 Tax=Chondromyces apiculatus DSM 436 TaxID=1192034 RepID=A0A017T404_9BACT|nr:hypothetical protein [Chondromyces apiculatus]EYF03973.1 vcbs protein [Chondromyces apiculatus DSM 436]
MRAAALPGVVALMLAGGCAVVYGYGDYEDRQPGGEGTCTSAESCPPSTECGQWRCEAGSCQVDGAASAGIRVAAQVVGDCKRLQCDGAGRAVAIPDLDDLPEDGEECTKDSCTFSGPVHEPLEDGKTCGAMGPLACEGGVCKGCSSSLQCGSTFCVLRTCRMATGECLVTPVAEGTSCSPEGTASCEGDAIYEGRQCDGAGACRRVVKQSCFPHACAGNVCGDGCSGHGDCAAGASCVDEACVDCVSCGEWAAILLSGGTAAPTCPGSDKKAEALNKCICEKCSEACAVLCGSGGSDDPEACGACVDTQCSGEQNGCATDVGH